MAIARGIKSVLLLAFLITCAALTLAAHLNRLSPREMVAPEAWAALDRHDPERAAAIFDRELQQQPRDPVLHFGAASAAYALGRPASALESVRRAVEIDPGFVEALTLLGQIAYERGDTDLAIRSMQRASALRPRDRHLGELLDQWQRETSVQRSYIEKPSGHFRILYEGPSDHGIGDHIAGVLEREYWRIGKALNSYPAGPLTVTLYTNQEFHDLTRSPSWSAGNYDGQIRLAVGNVSSSGRMLDRLATHELVHAVVASVAARRVPTWLNEGLASYLESNDRSWATDALRVAGDVLPLDALAGSFGGLDPQSALVAYAESATAAEILCSQLGTNVGGFLQSVGHGNTIDQALLEFQVQPNAFHSEWRRRVGLR
ncbi:MAG TPA: tetratricopeptide repeat protein [Vicinamibacterales bacterium]